MRLMPELRKLAASVILICAAGTAHAQSAVSSADQTAIEQVISGQIAAFGRNDAAAAFGFAAPNIQTRFGDGPHFLEMVREAYPPVFHPRSFHFSAVTPEKGLLTQKVELIGADGEPALALYSMEHEADGTWRIAGCSLVQGADTEI